MKKIICVTSVLLFICLTGKSQCDLKLKENILSMSEKEGFTGLKEFYFEINKPSDTVQYKFQLDKKNTYRVYFGISDKYLSETQLSISLKGTKTEEQMLKKGISQKDFNPMITDVLGLNLKMMNGNKTCGIILIAVANSSAAAKTKLFPDKNSNNPAKSDNTVSFMVDEMPEFIVGKGEMAFREWIAQNIKDSELDKNRGIQGKVYVQFNVNPEGNVKDIKVIRGLDAEIDAYIVNVFKTSPKWQKPGKVKNKAVTVQFVVPVIIKNK
jgi:TonB family protein